VTITASWIWVAITLLVVIRRAKRDGYGNRNGRGLPMPHASQSQGAPHAALRYAAPPIAGFVAVIFAVATHAFADAHHPGGEIFGRPFMNSPIPLAAGGIVSTSLSPPPAEILPEEPAFPEVEGPADGAALAAQDSRPAGPAWLNRLSRRSKPAGPDGWWLGMGGVALALAICGAIGIAARRLSPRAVTGAVQVVGRVSLSPKHTVYLLRVGQRVLLIGAGAQGAPALLGELDDLPEASPSLGDGGEP
jgi:hypothetical protein